MESFKQNKFKVFWWLAISVKRDESYKSFVMWFSFCIIAWQSIFLQQLSYKEIKVVYMIMINYIFKNKHKCLPNCSKPEQT